MGKIGVVISLIYVLLGLYLINLVFNFIVMPDFILGMGTWINAIAGVFLILGGYFFWKYNKTPSF